MSTSKLKPSHDNNVFAPLFSLGIVQIFFNFCHLNCLVDDGTKNHFKENTWWLINFYM